MLGNWLIRGPLMRSRQFTIKYLVSYPISLLELNPEISRRKKAEVEQITKADRNACHALCSKGKSRAMLRQLSSTVLRTIIIDANR